MEQRIIYFDILANNGLRRLPHRLDSVKRFAPVGCEAMAAEAGRLGAHAIPPLHAARSRAQRPLAFRTISTMKRHLRTEAGRGRIAACFVLGLRNLRGKVG